MNRILILKNELTNDPEAVGYSGMNDQQTTDSLNAKTISTAQDIITRDIQKYLSLNGLLLQIEDSTANSARNAVKNMQLFSSFTMSEPAVNAALVATLDALVTDSLITNADKDNILLLGSKLISRGEQLGLGVVKVGEVMESNT